MLGNGVTLYYPSAAYLVDSQFCYDIELVMKDDVQDVCCVASQGLQWGSREYGTRNSGLMIHRTILWSLSCLKNISVVVLELFSEKPAPDNTLDDSWRPLVHSTAAKLP